MQIIEFIVFVIVMIMMLLLTARQQRQARKKAEAHPELEDLFTVQEEPSPRRRAIPIDEEEEDEEDVDLEPQVLRRFRPKPRRDIPAPPPIPAKQRAMGDLVMQKYEFSEKLDDYWNQTPLEKQLLRSSLDDRLPKSTYEVIRRDVGTSRAQSIVNRSRSLKDAIILQELFNKPKAFRDDL